MKKHTEKKTKQKFKEGGDILRNNNRGITLIALVITTIVHYVERLNAVISRVECI